MPDDPSRLLRKPLRTLRDLIEIYLPSLAFAVMFLTFILQIFFRYVVRQPLQWAYEVTVSCYIWLVLLGACLGQREKAHVSFTMVTDKMKVRPRAAAMFLGDLLIFVAFAYSFLPNLEFIAFMARQKTAIFKVGMNLVYLPYIPFMLLMMGYLVRDMVPEFRVFTGLAGREETEAFDRASRPDFEAAVSAVPDLLEKIAQEVEK